MNEMSTSTKPASEPDPPAAAVKRRRGLSLVWAIPLTAAVIAAWLAYNNITSRGPRIQISFETAEGLEPGTTKIKYREVDVGTVEEVRLSLDLQHILVTAQMVKGAEPYMTSGTRFWIVRPRVGTGGVSGLGTLVSGAYVEVDPGQGEPAYEFVGLEEPPQIRSSMPGSQYTLRADSLGSVTRGAPVYFRGIEVGQVLGYELAPDNYSLNVRIFVRSPQDRLVQTNSRFWNASGVRLAASAEGLRVNIASIQSLLVGGIEFDTPRAMTEAQPAASGAEFPLFDSYDEAQAAQFTRKVPFLVNFEGSARGLHPGSPVETRGIRIGQVTDVRLAYSESLRNLVVRTLIEIEPERIQAVDAATGTPQAPQQDVGGLVAQGLRAQLKTGNLLTGELLVDLDFHPEAQAANMTTSGDFPVIPAVPTDLEAIQASATAILDKLADLPIEELIGSLNNTVKAVEAMVAAPGTQDAVASVSRSMASLQETLGRLETNAGPVLASLKTTTDAAALTLRQAQETLAAAERTLGPRLNADVTDVMRELQNAARSIRVFADYLERHPEALIRGRTGGR